MKLSMKMRKVLQKKYSALLHQSQNLKKKA